MMIPEYFEFQVGARVVFGRGLVDSAGEEVLRLGLKNVLIVTDAVLVKVGLADRVSKGLADGGVKIGGVFSDVPENSEIGVVRDLVEQARRAGVDGFVAVGGGSVMDTAKAANMVLSEGGDPLDYQGINLLERPLRPLVAVPTTAGTGSEVTNFAVVKDNENEVKIHFNSPYLVPALAVLDPEMTASMPPGLTAATGFDALTHAIEAYVSQTSEPITDALALGAIGLIRKSLQKAVEYGADLEARERMLLASHMAGIAFSNAGVGVVHAIAHVLGGIYGVPHGIANALMLPSCMAYNMSEVADRYAAMAGVLGASPDEEDQGAAAVEAVRELRKALALPEKLSTVGVPEDGLERVAGEALLDGAIFFNPREATEEELLAIVREAF